MDRPPADSRGLTMIGEKLGSFRIESVLGTGAMGVVYLAVNEASGRSAAVKVINGESSQKGKAYERFRREAEILQQFRHPNIVRFLALGRYKGTSYFAMEYVDGVTLDAILKERKALPWLEVVDLAIQICDALHYAHEHGVVHRDLKPSNLMVSGKGQIKLTDFGIAKDLDATALTATGRTLGTAAYMAPEQIRGTPEISHKTDLYALGILIYQMLTGQQAFEGTSAVVLMHCHLNEPPPKPRAKTYDIAVELDELVVRLMAKSPADRPWDAAAVGHTLRELREKVNRGEAVKMVRPAAGAGATNPTRAGLDTSQSSPGPSQTRSRSRPRGPFRLPVDARPWIATGLLVLSLAAIGGFIGYMLWPPGAAYLFRQAEARMASKDRHVWRDARDNYIDPLDRRFPRHRYRETTRAWRDRILTNEAEERAKVLASPLGIKLTEPKDENERTFVGFHTLAGASTEHGNELAAVEQWEMMARQLHPDDPAQRPWFLLARKRADDLRTSIAQRATMVGKLLQSAEAADAEGRPREALAIRREILARYGKFTDLAELLSRRPDRPPPTLPLLTRPRPEGPPPRRPGPAPHPGDLAAPICLNHEDAVMNGRGPGRMSLIFLSDGFQ
ncbi:MAG: serine/threonine-protein kinase [Singulisphaera sp.]